LQPIKLLFPDDRYENESSAPFSCDRIGHSAVQKHLAGEG